MRWGIGCGIGLLIAALGWAPAGQSAPVYGKVCELAQPDGSLVPVRIWGDEFYQVVESLDGYTLIRDPETGAICYADLSLDGAELVSTGIALTSSNQSKTKTTQSLSESLRNLEPHLRISCESLAQKVTALREEHAAKMQAGVEDWTEKVHSKSSQAFSNSYNVQSTSANTSGEVRGICLLIDFPDEPGTIPPEEIDRMLNQPGYSNYENNGSVRDFYFDVSGGRLLYTNYVTSQYYTAKYEKSYYDNPSLSSTVRTHLLLKEALNNLEASGFDFSEYDSDEDGFIDAVHGFYAGNTQSGWGKGLWPHTSIVNFEADGVQTKRYQVTPITDTPSIGTFCHESGHVLYTWPDLYDYDFDSRGIGYFCLMANGDFDTNPVQPCAYLKELAGWNTIQVLNEPQECSLEAGGATAYKIPHPSYAGEYYLIENRIQSGRDAQLPDSGLLIWHIDRTFGNQRNQQQSEEKHYLVTLVQADGHWDLEGRRNGGDVSDLWGAPEYITWTPNTLPAALWWDNYPCGVSITEISEPGETMSFIFGLDATPEPPENFNTEENFPDPNFRHAVEELLETSPGGYFTKARAAAVSAIKGRLVCSGMGIHDLTGLEHLPGLTSLDCSWNAITTLDVSPLAELVQLECYNVSLEKINLSGCTKLETLRCTRCSLKELDVSQNPSLQTVDCGGNKLQTLDLSNHLNLTDLQCRENDLMELNISGCTGLEQLECSYNQLTTLDLSYLSALQSATCIYNKLEVINAQNCQNLFDLDCRENQIAALNLHGCVALETLDCSKNSLQELDLTDCIKLQEILCGKNLLMELDLRHCTALNILQCFENKLECLFVPKTPALATLRCYENNLSELDVSECPGLQLLDCQINNIERLDISGSGNLLQLYCMETRLSELILPPKSALKILSCNDCYLPSLDLSGFANLESLYCQNNLLESLLLSGCESLRSVSCESNKITAMSLDGCGSLEELDCQGNQLEALDFTDCHNLQELFCNNNRLYGIDLANNSSLKTIECADNQITNLDLSGCTRLEKFTIDRNPFDVIDLSDCTALYQVEMNNLQARRLNMIGCNELRSFSVGDIFEVDEVFLGSCSSLRSLSFRRGVSRKITTLDISGCGELASLDCSNVQLVNLNLAGCVSLMKLYCDHNLLSTLDISDSMLLREINCSDNEFEELPAFLDIPELIGLDISNNRLGRDDWGNVMALWLRLGGEWFPQSYHVIGLVYSPQKDFDPYDFSNEPTPTPTPTGADVNDWFSF